MKFEEVIKNRYSLRDYDEERKVSDEVLKRVIEMAINAPSACNGMPYEIYVARGEKKNEIAKSRKLMMNKFMEKADVIFVIVESNYNLQGRVGDKLQKNDFRSIDIGIMTQNICLSAASLGLGTCIIGMYDEEKIKKIVGTDEKIRLLISMGYEKKSGKPAKKKSVEDVFKII